MVWRVIDDILISSASARHPGYKAAYTYAIETYHDKDIWELHEVSVSCLLERLTNVLTGVQALDGHMTTVSGFNNRDVKRREWQNGSMWHWRYYFRVPMFLPYELRAARPDPPANLHQWVVAAHQKSRTYRANPARPIVCGLERGRIERISDCTPSQLEYGDVVSLVFTLHYMEDRDDWGPVTMLTHIVRVQHANKDVYRVMEPPPVEDCPVDDIGLQPGTIIDGRFPYAVIS